MATVQPFKAMRYDYNLAGTPESLISPPYDIVSDQEQDRLELANPYNVIRLEKPRGENCYVQSADILKDWMSKGILKIDNDDSFYIYQEEFNFHNFIKKITGLIGKVHLENFENGIVLPHEETLSKAKEDRFQLMCETYCNFSPIYGLYMDPEKDISSVIEHILIRQPIVELKDGDQIIHRLWKFSDPDAVKKIQQSFYEKKIYIADGHHRYETGLRFRDYMKTNAPDEIIREGSKNIMMLLADMEDMGLCVLPTHRLVKNVKGFEPSKVLSYALSCFDVEKHTDFSAIEDVLKNNENSVVYYYGSSEYFLLKKKDSVDVQMILTDKSEAYCSLDVTMLHTLIIEPALGIGAEKMASSEYLSYTRNISEAINEVRNGNYQCSFILNPTKVTQIRDVATAGEKMPQKSTYFYPKPTTGLVMNNMRF